MGMSAWVEVSGLTLWAVDLWRAMGRQPLAVVSSERIAIEPGTKVFDVIHRYPETAPLFREFGFVLVDNPVAQRVFARSVSLEQACRLKHVDFAEFQAALNRRIQKSGDSDALIQIGGSQKAIVEFQVPEPCKTRHLACRLS
jgi:hypothetical protein